MDYLYCEPVKNEVLRCKVLRYDPKEDTYTVQYMGKEVSAWKDPLGEGYSANFDGVYGFLYLGDEEWVSRYQESLSRRVSQISLTVYVAAIIKRGKKNTRVLAISGDGIVYHTLVPTYPAPVVGQELNVLKCDLSLGSSEPQWEVLKNVLASRGKGEAYDAQAVS